MRMQIYGYIVAGLLLLFLLGVSFANWNSGGTYFSPDDDARFGSIFGLEFFIALAFIVITIVILRFSR